jgi:large subunit ribosomal protein L35
VVPKFKIKTHKPTAKRFKYTGTGKLTRTRQMKSHLRRTKPQRVKSLFDEMLVVTHKGTIRRVARLAPYLKKG